MSVTPFTVASSFPVALSPVTSDTDTTDGPMPVGRRTVKLNAPFASARTCTPATAGSMSVLVGVPYCGFSVSSANGAAPVPLYVSTV